MWRGNAFSRVCLCLCVCPIPATPFESLNLEASFLYATTSSKYLGHLRISISSVQGQGHMSKQACLCVRLNCNVECLDLQTSLWYAGTSTEYLGQGRVSRSWSQCQGHSVVTKYMHADGLLSTENKSC